MRESERDRVDFQRMLDRKRANRFREIDSLSPALRELVHEYGWNIVKSFLTLGVREPRHIRHLVETVLDDFSPTRGAFSIQGVRNNIAATLSESKEQAR